MSGTEPPGPSPEAKALAKRALFGDLDGKLSAAGYAVPAAAPPPAPPPALSFEDWAELHIGYLSGAPPQELAAALSARGVAPAEWTRLHRDYLRALSDDLLSGKQELSAIYEAKRKALTRL